MTVNRNKITVNANFLELRLTEQIPSEETVREKKRRQTLLRVAQVGLQMFAENGYEETTLEAIARKADISPRTLFYYFKTKEDVLTYFQGRSFIDALSPTISTIVPDALPLEAVFDVLIALVDRYETPESILVDRIMRSTESLNKQKMALFSEMETIIFSALCNVWANLEPRSSLRLVAMLSIGVLRLAMDDWRESNGSYPLSHYLRTKFEELQNVGIRFFVERET